MKHWALGLLGAVSRRGLTASDCFSLDDVWAVYLCSVLLDGDCMRVIVPRVRSEVTKCGPDWTGGLADCPDEHVLGFVSSVSASILG